MHMVSMRHNQDTVGQIRLGIMIIELHRTHKLEEFQNLQNAAVLNNYQNLSFSAAKLICNRLCGFALV